MRRQGGRELRAELHPRRQGLYDFESSQLCFGEDLIRPESSEPAEEHLRWVIGNRLGIFADPSVADDLIELALDRRFGQARTQIVEALPKTKDERVPSVLLDLLDDPTVAAFAVEALGKMKYTRARASIEKLLTHSDINIRNQARKGVHSSLKERTGVKRGFGLPFHGCGGVCRAC